MHFFSLNPRSIFCIIVIFIWICSNLTSVLFIICLFKECTLIWNSPSVDSSMLELGNYPASCLLCTFAPPDTRPEWKLQCGECPHTPDGRKYEESCRGAVWRSGIIHIVMQRDREGVVGKYKTNCNTKASWEKVCNAVTEEKQGRYHQHMHPRSSAPSLWGKDHCVVTRL